MDLPAELLSERTTLESLLRYQGFLAPGGRLEDLGAQHAELVAARPHRVLEAVRSHEFRMQWVATAEAHHVLGPSAFPHWRHCSFWEGQASSLAAEKGTLNHAGLNALLRGVIQEDDAMPEVDEQASKDVKWAASTFRAVLGENAVFEHRVAFCSEGVFFAGTLDGASDVAIADFKSGLPPRDYDHSDQIAGYCAAWMQERWWIDEMKGWVVFGRARRSRSSWWTYESAKSLAMEVARRRMNRVGAPVGGDSCNLCAQALQCPTWLRAHHAESLSPDTPVARLRLPLPEFVTNPDAVEAMAKAYFVTKRWVESAGEVLSSLAGGGMPIPAVGTTERAGRQDLLDPASACDAVGLPLSFLLKELRVSAAALARAVSKHRGIPEAAARAHVDTSCRLRSAAPTLVIHSNVFK